jgi:hypothetical protein
MSAAGEITLGLVLGYVIASLTESSLHRAIKHGRRRARTLWRRYPRVFQPFLRAYYSHHIVHHALTFRQDFVTQFRDPADKERLDRQLSGPLGDLIRREQYGLTLRGSGILAFNVPILPFLPLIGFSLGPWVLLGALPGLFAYSAITIFLHPYLHRRHDDAIREAPVVLRWLLRTRFVKAAARNHYLHHRYIRCNYNLLLGGDFLLGQHRAASAQDLADMRTLGLAVD